MILSIRVARTAGRLLPPILGARIAPILAGPRPRPGRSKLSCRSITGSRLDVDPGDLHGYRFALTGFYDFRNVAIAFGAIPRDRTSLLLEGGANVGTETVSFSDVVGNRGRVIALEASPVLAEELRSNCAGHALANVSVHALALADFVGELPFAVSSDERSGEGHLVVSTGAEATTTVPVTTMDALLPRGVVPDVIVMDVEGAELKVLRGARSSLSTHPVLVLEASPQLLARAGDSLGDLVDELTSNGYDIFRVGRFGLAELDPEHLGVSDENWCALERGRPDLRARISREIFLWSVVPPLVTRRRVRARAEASAR